MFVFCFGFCFGLSVLYFLVIFIDIVVLARVVLFAFWGLHVRCLVFLGSVGLVWRFFLCRLSKSRFFVRVKDGCYVLPRPWASRSPHQSSWRAFGPFHSPPFLVRPGSAPRVGRRLGCSSYLIGCPGLDGLPSLLFFGTRLASPLNFRALLGRLQSVALVLSPRALLFCLPELCPFH